MRRSVVAGVVLAVAAAVPATSVAADAPAPGAPGARGIWTPADKHAFGTAAAKGSRVWFTLRQRTITEAYWPRIDTPAVRDLEFAVVDRGRVTFESGATRAKVAPLDARSLSYRQTVTARDGAWRLTKDVVTDDARNALDVRVRLQSLRGRKPKLFALLDPALSNTPGDDTAGRDRRGLVASDRQGAVALQSEFGLRPLTSAYKDRPGDPRRQLRRTGGLGARPFVARKPGNVVQGARVRLRGGRATVTMGFGTTRKAASDVAAAAIGRGFAQARKAYDEGWNDHLDGLPAPASLPADLRPSYDRSLLVLAASEDKTDPGAGVASPSMPWAWGRLTIDKGRSGPYHLVWPRDLYQVGSALLAAGDTAAANRAVDYLFGTQQKADGTFPQNSRTDGTPFWTGFQLDETALPIVLAWQAGRNEAALYPRIAKAADAIVRRGPQTEQERWENQSGFSPSAIAAAIAALVCAGDIARANGDPDRAAAWEAKADEWRAKVDGWTATPNGPYSDSPYYLRVTKDGKPGKGTRYDGGDGGPGKVDQRRVVDQSFLELVRLGVKRPDDPVVRNSLAVTDDELAVRTPNGTYYRRFSFDGYGERRDGRPWDLSKPNTFGTLGRAWPLLAGERGEYELLNGGTADAQLRAIAASANDGGMMPEQVWDGRRPTGRPGFEAGEGTRSATPLAWTHAQFVRLAWAIDAGRPVEQPAVVAARYAGTP